MRRIDRARIQKGPEKDKTCTCTCAETPLQAATTEESTKCFCFPHKQLCGTAPSSEHAWHSAKLHLQDTYTSTYPWGLGALELQRVLLISLLALLLGAREATSGMQPAEKLLALQLPCAGRSIPACTTAA